MLPSLPVWKAPSARFGRANPSHLGMKPMLAWAWLWFVFLSMAVATLPAALASGSSHNTMSPTCTSFNEGGGDSYW